MRQEALVHEFKVVCVCVCACVCVCVCVCVSQGRKVMRRGAVDSEAGSFSA